MTLYEELKERGLIERITSDDLIEKLNTGCLNFYIGTDPTADSLHIGHLSSLLMALRLKNAGHNPYILIGGGTGLIGDPRKTSERDVINKNDLDENFKALKTQIKTLFGCRIVNNYDWYKDVNFIDYLRDYGKLFNINYMLDKETVKSRLNSGISYTEFSYMILQSIDFLHLFEEEKITLQLGGQDQWGNITSGLELIRKRHGANTDCYGLTMPLITKADGTKFGKSESGTVWLDPNKTSSYDMYQFLLNSEDSKVIDYLKKLTFLSLEEISQLEQSLKEHPEKREAGKRLAYEVVYFIHGMGPAEEAKRKSEEIFSNKGVSEHTEIKEISKDLINNINIVDFLLLTDLFPSKSEARRMVEQNAISINSNKINDPKTIITLETFLNNELLLQKGKKQFLRIVLI